MNIIKIWLKQTRANFLVLPVMLVAIGCAAAHAHGKFDWGLSALLLIGSVLSHVSVNLFNEYSDYKTGIDFKTERTPFSGGSGNLQQNLTKPWQVFFAASLSLLIAFLIGIYLMMHSGWIIVIFMMLGGIACVFYTSHLSHVLLGELFAGMCLGSFVVLGSYYVLAKSLPFGIIMISIPPGILTALLLFLNEFPDAEADKSGGRRHLVIVLGKKKASALYVIGLAATYFFIIISVVFKLAPATILISLLTIPFAVKAALIALKHATNTKALIPALGFNVIVVLLTDLLLAVGFVI